MAGEPVIPLLEVTDLAVTYAGDVEALRGVSFSVQPGESLAVVGESGSGKTTLAHCLAGVVQPPEARGSVRVQGEELLGATAETLRSLRWSTVALALQGAPFNPVATVGNQVAEPLRDRLGLSAAAAAGRAEELAREVSLDPALLGRYPHELSGGERRRAAVAMTLGLDPALVVLDEPTAGLDPVTRRSLVWRIAELARQHGFALIVISHDLPDATHMAERCLVLYAGEAMEAGPTSQVMKEPAHPYTWALINAYPVMSTTKELRPIKGRPPDPRAVLSGCPFRARCTQADDVCVEHPALSPSRGRLVACHFGGLKTLLAATGVSKTYRRGNAVVTALDGVDLAVAEGESVGIVGPSGSGKSTLARILCGHMGADAGEVVLESRPLPRSWRRSDRQMRRRIQLVMQDPWEALSPRFTVGQLVREPLDVAGDGSSADHDRAVGEMLDAVGLPSSGPFLGTRSHELSGGQLQRVALARALVGQPKLVVADEPTSMLDASEQARLLVTLRERQIEMGLGLVFVSHDMAVVRKVTDRIVVLDAGRVVEEGPSHDVSSDPTSAAARELFDAAPTFAPDRSPSDFDRVPERRP
ncbi:MAG: ABC transporter ATP-binding protein [Candidatus Aeolococcus gillhamiae]|uniref:ABC transporter ATP-binding protein n=1 Tax=Candidatus Aeolococcus gillhamiae TaxID=3127015 RepID=A0A2W5YYK9_9BACT|nr:MAG: ABC transporter ATP-binding protein [Candidatus Dormibacter sp. RRmetagenome_bin12]